MLGSSSLQSLSKAQSHSGNTLESGWSVWSFFRQGLEEIHAAWLWPPNWPGFTQINAMCWERTPEWAERSLRWRRDASGSNRTGPMCGQEQHSKAPMSVKTPPLSLLVFPLFSCARLSLTLSPFLVCFLLCPHVWITFTGCYHLLAEPLFLSDLSVSSSKFHCLLFSLHSFPLVSWFVLSSIPMFE